MNEVIDSRAFSNFCGINTPEEVPDGDTIGRFRNLLTKNGLQEKIFAAVVEILMERGLILKKGTIVDSTFIESPSSTKNREKKRDPEAHSAKKGDTRSILAWMKKTVLSILLIIQLNLAVFELTEI